MPHNQYLQQRRKGWYVRLAVPRQLVRDVGKTHIVKSLRTRDINTARLRRWQAIADFQALFATLRAEQGGTLDAARDAATTATVRRQPPAQVSVGAQQMRALACASNERPRLVRASGIPLPPPRGPQLAKGYEGEGTSLISELVDKWLGETADGVTKQTAFQQRSAVSLLLEEFSPNLTVGEVSRRRAGMFVTEYLIQSGRTPATNNRLISSLSSFWRWLVRRGYAVENPWSGQSVPTRSKLRDSVVKRAYTTDELLRLLGGRPTDVVGPRYGEAISDLMRLGLLTGARINEICELQVADVLEDAHAISIREGKTANARRIIPVHGWIWPILQRRKLEAKNGPLFPELARGGPDGKRSWYASKRYSSYRVETLGKGREVDFHSFRRTFATYLERASTIKPTINASVIAELMGHSKQTLALNTYSAGLELKHLVEAMSVLSEVVEPQLQELLISRA